MRSIEDKGCCNYGSVQDNSGFEFHKGSHHLTVLGSLSKPTPSKWDDAQKWLAGLSSGADQSHAKTKPRFSNTEDRKLIGPIPQKDSCSSADDGVEDGEPETMNQDEGETKKIDCNESFWRIDKPSEGSMSAVRSVCARDMGTEMTPIASHEPSRTGTPLRATTPAVTSPISSNSSTPGHQGAQALESYQNGFRPLQGRSEAAHFGMSSSAWPVRQKETDASRVQDKRSSRQERKPNSLETRAMAWDEAERAKYMARYKGEEVKIQAWENHEKRKAEMEMRRMEVKAERLKSRAQEKLANKLAATRRMAEEKRANAETKLNEQAIKTSERANDIRRTGHLPSSFPFKLPSLCW